jgi:hypothetical protein
MKRSNTLKGINPVGEGGGSRLPHFLDIRYIYSYYNKLRQLPGFVPPPPTHIFLNWLSLLNILL